MHTRSRGPLVETELFEPPLRTVLKRRPSPSRPPAWPIAGFFVSIGLFFLTVLWLSEMPTQRPAPAPPPPEGSLHSSSVFQDL